MNYSASNNLQTQHRIRSIFENTKQIPLYMNKSSHPETLREKILFPNLKYEQYFIVLPKFLKNTCVGAQFQQRCRPKVYNFTR